jgi:type IV pilus assembly protein PilB
MVVLGVQPQFLASGLLGVVTQRLIRKLCLHCRIPLQPDEVFDIHTSHNEQMYIPSGCSECHGTGYAGRVAVGEVLRVTREVERMIRSGASMYQIHKRAVEEGMIDLRADAQQKLDLGITSPDEILRVIPGNFAETF